MKLIYPPDNTKDIEGKSIFLAESIEMNEAIDWQQEVIDKLSVIKSEITIFNPRRKDWDSW